MPTSITGGYVSADGHVVEPADLWTTRIDKRFRDRAPHIETRKSIDFYVIDGLDPAALGLDGAALESKIADKVESPVARHADTRPGASDPQHRLKDQALDNPASRDDLSRPVEPHALPYCRCRVSTCRRSCL